MSEEKKTIIWHTCRSNSRLYKKSEFEPGKRYFPVSGEFDENGDFRMLPDDCVCRKVITLSEARNFVANGKAQYLCKVKGGATRRTILLNFVDRASGSALYMEATPKSHKPGIVAHVERGQTPRVDMITAADVQRAVIGSERKILAFTFNPETQRFEPAMAKNPTEAQKKAWFALLDLENTHERRIRKQYEEYIRLSHNLAMQHRSEMFRGIILENGKKVGGQPEFLDVEEEQKGRPLFWCKDERTKKLDID
jgi:hypothetical protein